MEGFGLAFVRREGAPIHPDDCDADLSDEQYLRQLKAYAKEHGMELTKKTFCCRPEFLKELEAEPE